jgi:uncharacterized protein YbjT (DUF2867 family)
MDRSDRIILVTGATGHQGGAAARHLLADGWRVRAFVRDAEKPASRTLAEAGAEIAVGDLRDGASIDAAMTGAYGAYSVQTPRDGIDTEIAEAHNLAEAAKAAGVEHIVYSSVIGADRPSEQPWVKSKHEIESWLADLGVPFTVLRPVTFMENLLGQKDEILGGKLKLPEPADYVHQRIAADDIGRFIALAFREPDRWIGTSMDIAGDEQTGSQAAEYLSRALGVAIEFEAAPPAGWAPSPSRADVARCRSLIPGLRRLDEWTAEMRSAGVWGVTAGAGI